MSSALRRSGDPTTMDAYSPNDSSVSEAGADPRRFDTPRDVCTRLVTMNLGSSSTARRTNVDGHDARGSKNNTGNREARTSTTIDAESATLDPATCATAVTNTGPARTGTNSRSTGKS